METSEIEDVLKDLPPNPQKKDVAKVVEKVRSRVIGQLRAEELAKQLPGSTVLREVEVLEEDTMTLEQFDTATQKQKQGRTRHIGLDGKERVYKKVTDIDALVLDEQLAAGKKAKMLRLDQEKTGHLDTGAKAKAQNDAAVKAILQDVSGGKKVVLRFERRDITSQVDLASVSQADKVSVGPANKKGFDESLGVTATDLERLTEELLADTLKKEMQP